MDGTEADATHTIRYIVQASSIGPCAVWPLDEGGRGTSRLIAKAAAKAIDKERRPLSRSSREFLEYQLPAG